MLTILKSLKQVSTTGLEAAQKELAAAIEAGDAEAQVAANKKIATLAFENAKLEQSKSARETEVSKPADVKTSTTCNKRCKNLVILWLKHGLQRTHGLDKIEP